jgi:hypothetical protein
VDVPIVVGDERAPRLRVIVRVKTVEVVPSGPPAGAVDAPGDPIRLGASPIVFQGWAVDAFDLRRVYVTYDDSHGAAVTLGEARRAGERSDISALLPDAHDLFNAGWTFSLDPSALRGLPFPLRLRFHAQGARRETEIGTRTLIR